MLDEDKFHLENILVHEFGAPQPLLITNRMMRCQPFLSPLRQHSTPQYLLQATALWTLVWKVSQLLMTSRCVQLGLHLAGIVDLMAQQSLGASDHLNCFYALQRAYHSARRRRLYDKRCYMISNESEYWAEGCQSWFDATVRCGANQGGFGPDG